MEIKLVDSPDKELLDFFENRIEEFNNARWEIKKKRPVAVCVKAQEGVIIAGAAGKTFGKWLLIDNLWVAEHMRGSGLGSRVLKAMEASAKERGCEFVLLDTLNFQARPFYEKHGYECQWVQPHYPRDGCKYFMVKVLDSDRKARLMTAPTLFTVSLSKVGGRELPAGVVRAHIEYLRRLDDRGRLVLCGPFADHPSGLVIVRAKDRAEAAEMAEEDPFVREGFRTYEIRTWRIANSGNNYLG
ncbi:MAG: GNAT family N-acetyltransferase [Bdellovibrionales bacterium]